MSVSVFIKKVGFASYGVSPKPALPKGWSYFERPGQWRLGQSPDGEYWFAGETLLCRLKFASEWDVLKSQVRSWFNHWIKPFEEGDIYADTSQIIEL